MFKGTVSDHGSLLALASNDRLSGFIIFLHYHVSIIKVPSLFQPGWEVKVCEYLASQLF